MSATLPTNAIITGEYRALMLYEAAPDGCGTVIVPDDAFAPHLKCGELAVIDADDKEPIAGEIYVVKIASPRCDLGYRLTFVQLRAGTYTFGTKDATGCWQMDPEQSVGWMMHFQLIRPRPAPKFYATMGDAARNVSTWSLCDGPLRTEGMRSYIVGRVVGLVMPTGGVALQ